MSTVYASPIWLGRPHCPVTVTTGAGAVVTAALGSLTLTATADANGLCAMKLPRRGRWSFTAVLGGKKGFGTLAVPGQRSLSLPLYSTTLAENSWAEIAAAAAAESTSSWRAWGRPRWPWWINATAASATWPGPLP